MVDDPMHLSLADLQSRGPTIGEPRAVTAEDLGRRPKAAQATRKKLRYRHHALARALASGLPEGTAAAITGYALSTVSILKADRTFQDLMKFYASEDSKGYDAVRTQLLGLGQRFLEEMEDRIKHTPGDMTMRDLRESAELLLDRAGYGPASQATHEVHIHAGLADALKSSRVNAPYPALPAPTVVDATFEELPTSPGSEEGAAVPHHQSAPSFTWDES